MCDDSSTIINQNCTQNANLSFCTFKITQRGVGFWLSRDADSLAGGSSYNQFLRDSTKVMIDAIYSQKVNYLHSN